MMKFKYKHDKHERVYTDPGSPIKIEFQLRIIDNHEEIVETGKSNLYEYIQSHADSVDITKILERCALIDDYSLLNRMPAQFMDVTEMPKTLAEAFAQVQDAKNFFDRMPMDIKEKYNQNYLEFISDIGSERFMHNVSDYLETLKKAQEVKEKAEEVKEKATDES